MDAFRTEYRELGDSEKAAIKEIKDLANALYAKLGGPSYLVVGPESGDLAMRLGKAQPGTIYAAPEGTSIQSLPIDGRMAHARERLEECVMWAVKAITE